MERKTIIDKNFVQFRKFIEESVDKSVFMTYLKKEKTNKKIVKEDGTKEDNPYNDKIVKMTTVEFVYGRKYSDEVKSVNPEYEFKGPKVEYTKLEENDMLEKDVKGELSIGVVDPINKESEYFLWNEENMLEKWNPEERGDVHNYLPARKTFSMPSSGVIFRRYKYSNIQSLSVGDTYFINPDFLKENNEENQ